MHQSVRNFVADQMQGHEPYGQVTELGSAMINGHVRDLVPHDRWTGIDLTPGENVEIVANTHNVPLPDESADLVLWLEAAEHDDDPVATILEAARLLRPGHRLILTTRSEGFAYHCPPDLWRFTHDDIAALAYTAGLNVIEQRDDPQVDHPGVFAVLEKP